MLAGNILGSFHPSSDIHAYRHEDWTHDGIPAPWNDPEVEAIRQTNTTVFLGVGGFKADRYEGAVEKIIGGADLVVFDPPANDRKEEFGTDGIQEWKFLEEARPRYIAVHNTMMPFHGGWVVNRMKNMGYQVLAQGMHNAGDPENVKTFKDMFYLERGWAILYNTH